MHDFHLAKQIVEIAKRYAKKNGLERIDQIVLELGELTEHGENIKPENLKYNINLLLPCKIKVKKVKGDVWKLVNIEGK
jgi:Zn finger protein HypA/HybF involved in hydrogenase expression